MEISTLALTAGGRLGASERETDRDPAMGGGAAVLVTGHMGLSGIWASSCDRDLPNTSPTECWPLFQVPGMQERRVSGLGELVSSWGEETYVNTVHPRMQGKEIGGGAGGREVIRERPCGR